MGRCRGRSYREVITFRTFVQVDLLLLPVLIGYDRVWRLPFERGTAVEAAVYVVDSPHCVEKTCREGLET